MRAGTRLVRSVRVDLALPRRHPCETAGRIIGALGALCAAAFWGVMLIAALGILIDPGKGLAALVVLIAIPMGALASVLFVVSAADFVVLARRADTSMPWRVAATHAVMAVAIVWIGSAGAQRWLGAAALLVICATQLIAIRLFQMMPSQPSSQR